MCWPVDRPGTHAAAGAAARGIRGEELGGALLLFVLRACCGGMCWPVDRPATHAAAGAAARGIRGEELGGALLLFVLRACCGGMCWPVDRPATHAAAGAAARGVRGGLGDCFTPTGAARHACRLRRDGTRGYFLGGRATQKTIRPTMARARAISKMTKSMGGIMPDFFVVWGIWGAPVRSREMKIPE